MEFFNLKTGNSFSFSFFFFFLEKRKNSWAYQLFGLLHDYCTIGGKKYFGPLHGIFGLLFMCNVKRKCPNCSTSKLEIDLVFSSLEAEARVIFLSLRPAKENGFLHILMLSNALEVVNAIIVVDDWMLNSILVDIVEATKTFDRKD